MKFPRPNKTDLKEKFLVGLVMTGCFLPARIFFYTYVSKFWLGSFGLVSIIAVIMVILVKKKKLGVFGVIFERQMFKITHGKWGIFVICVTIIGIMFFTSVLILIDRAERLYNVEVTSFLTMINDPSIQYVLRGNEQKPDFVPSVTFAVMNRILDGWLQHFYIVILVGKLETLGMVLFYRRTFKKLPETK